MPGLRTLYPRPSRHRRCRLARLCLETAETGRRLTPKAEKRERKQGTGTFIEKRKEKGKEKGTRTDITKLSASPLCAVERRGSSVGANPTRQLLLQPVAIGAVVKATTLPEPSMQRVAWATRRVGRP